jgi:ssDNA-binding replication factor A large subunit
VIGLSVDFKKMVELLLKQRPEIGAEQIREMIDEKKRKVGAGYLTDQGALFLIGADLGISFESVPKSSSGIKELYIGAKEVTITARIMNIYPIRRFIKKDTNEEIVNRTMTVYDKDSSIKIRLWDNNQINIPDEMGLQPGDLIKVSRGYVKSGLDGKPIISLGSNGSIELDNNNNNNNNNNDSNPIPTIDSMTLTVDDVKDPQENVIIAGNVDSNPRISGFNNIRGQAGKALQMQISNEARTRSLRAIIWNIDENRIPKIFNTGVNVRLLGVRIKPGNPQYGNGDFEIHGDEGTMLQFSGSETDVEVTPLRIISVGNETGRGNINCLTVDRAGRFLSAIVDSMLVTNEMTTDTMIECVPSRIFGSSIILSKEDSYIRLIDDDPSFPTSSKFESKIKDIQVSESPYVVEAIVLHTPNMTEVNTKSGIVPVSDTLLGDDTGEIRLVGWREQSSHVHKLNVGDRIKVIGATANNGREANVELTLKSYSSIIKIN